MTSELGATTTEASLALTAFWGMVTVGRIFFAAVQRIVPSRVTYHALPFFLAAVFVVIARLPHDGPALGVLAFGLAGLGCSALLPLTISFGQEELTAFSAAAAGGIIAFYQLGYGIAAFGVGPLLDGGVELPTVYGLAAVVAAGMTERTVTQAKAQQAQMDEYVRNVAGSGGAAAEIEKAKGLLDSGAITQAEFESMKAKALAAS